MGSLFSQSASELTTFPLFFDPVFEMGEDTLTDVCSGTLFDSGGPNGDYANSENLTFTICPQDTHQCIFIHVASFAVEQDFDFINFFAGPDINAPLISSLTGSDANIEIQISSTCVTVQFLSDVSIKDAGFELTWTCAADPCSVSPPSTCDNPTVIPSLPYISTGLTTCNAGDSYNSSPCNNDDWLGSEDVVFTYTSAGQECIAIQVTGSNPGTGVGIFENCPNIANECIALGGGGLGQSDPTINAVFLEQAGTYYIVVDNLSNCTPFNIEIQQVSCPVVFPSAAFCEDALSLNGCGELPAIVSVAPGQGDPNFIQPGVNNGCWGNFQPNFTWFFFEAQADGEFGFVMQAAGPNEASDLDFQVWGPIFNLADACNYIKLFQPVRSSYAAGADPTGMANLHPVTGNPVLDTCEIAAGDDFVKTLNVIKDRYYFVLVNDWGGAITSGAVSIDFYPTTPGVLDAEPVTFTVSADTVVCLGQAVQLNADGGEVYKWFPANGLSCTSCPNPLVTVAEPSVYNVAINSICVNDTLEVSIGTQSVDAGPDVTVCLNAESQLSALASGMNASFHWTAPAGFLSCTDCPAPVLTGLTSGQFVISVSADFPQCTASDSLTVTVTAGEVPVYQISEDQNICMGDSVSLGGITTPGVIYNWSSLPAGFVSNAANPAVTPSASTVYFLEVMGENCPFPFFDSVLVNVATLPAISVGQDTSICEGEAVVLGNTLPESGVNYAWSPVEGLDEPAAANPVAAPAQSTFYTLTADRMGCSIQASIMVNVISPNIELTGPDTITVCKGTSVTLSAAIQPANASVNWLPDDGSLNQTSGLEVLATPQTATTYLASVNVAGCLKTDSIFIAVDSLPWGLSVMPADTLICEGATVTLSSAVFQAALFPEIGFQWSPPEGQLTPDTLPDLVVQPAQTTVYQRITKNGFCLDSTQVLVTVIPTNAIEVIPAQADICAGESVQLMATSILPITFSWQPSAGLSCNDCPNPVAMPDSTTTYSVIGNYEGCPVNGSVTVTLLETPFIIPPTGLLCPGEMIVLNFAPNASWNYVWTSPDDPAFTSAAPAPLVSPAQTTTYEVMLSNGDCPAENFSVVVEVAGLAELVVSNDTTVCPGDPLTLTASANVSGTFTWEPGNFMGASYPVAGAAEGIYDYMVTFFNGCTTTSDTILVEVIPGIEILEITNEKSDTVYLGTELQLGVVTSIPVADYLWSNGSDSDTLTVLPATLGNFNYAVTVSDDAGCTDTASTSITVLEPNFDIPNAFSPNNDELNQYFRVVIAGENIAVLSLQVWNRWGQLMYEEKNGNTGWDGQYKGEPVPSDVYVYRIRIRMPDGSEFLKSGDLTLLR